jgi:hypothetical protein
MRITIRRRPPGAVFVHPVDPAPRTAVLAAGFHPTKLVRVFPDGWNQHAERFSPASLAGSRERVFQAAYSGVGLDHSVIVFTYPGEPPLSAGERESLWMAFGVPVFEQYLSLQNKLLATECDAHFGLHVTEGYEDLDLETEVCVCGNRAPRLVRGARIDELAALLS